MAGLGVSLSGLEFSPWRPGLLRLRRSAIEWRAKTTLPLPSPLQRGHKAETSSGG